MLREVKLLAQMIQAALWEQDSRPRLTVLTLGHLPRVWGWMNPLHNLRGGDLLKTFQAGRAPEALLSLGICDPSQL